ncbi:MAG: Hsp20/alpha crystallin family protein [Deltaproteobacteria bacterium]|nr:Hsp20/alpha crystallin family protein [Deltaproteobacteria bacterium]
MAKKDSWLPAPFQQLSHEVDRLFDELIHRPWGVHRSQEPVWTPQLDLYEDAAAFVLEADLPGVQEKDTSVSIDKGELVLRGKRTFERICDEEHFHCRERQSGEFVRRLRLPASIDQDKIRADFHDGVLRVTLPKIKQAEQ